MRRVILHSGTYASPIAGWVYWKITHQGHRNLMVEVWSEYGYALDKCQDIEKEGAITERIKTLIAHCEARRRSMRELPEREDSPYN